MYVYTQTHTHMWFHHDLQQEAVANMRKTKSLYIARQQEYEKAKETAQKAETESLTQSSAGQATKVEKKKKQVEDALRKVRHNF